MYHAASFAWLIACDEQVSHRQGRGSVHQRMEPASLSSPLEGSRGRWAPSDRLLRIQTVILISNFPIVLLMACRSSAPSASLSGMRTLPSRVPGPGITQRRLGQPSTPTRLHRTLPSSRLAVAPGSALGTNLHCLRPPSPWPCCFGGSHLGWQ